MANHNMFALHVTCKYDNFRVRWLEMKTIQDFFETTAKIRSNVFAAPHVVLDTMKTKPTTL